ncbi:MAG: uracil-DNA glycosylase [bacterium]|nr:uracil-DNA glycosylase [bacterium]
MSDLFKNIRLEKGWKSVLADEFKKEYMQNLGDFLQDELKAEKTIFPGKKEWFTAFNKTPFDRVKAVILGQDPYHGPGQAHGLAFSVPPEIAPPPSLVNIFKEIETDLGFSPPGHGSLLFWAEQGVLLLNSVLTVEEGQAGSHRGKGWELFTDRVIEILNESHESLVFFLWGGYAHKKGRFIDANRHLVLKSAHPSPLSAHQGFWGNKQFSQTNSYLNEQGKEIINWELPSL